MNRTVAMTIFAGLTMLGIFQTGNSCAMAQARLIAIDKLISKENSEVLQNYLGEIDVVTDAKIYAVDFEGFKIVRIESSNSCLSDKCLTIVVRACAEKICPHVKLLAEPYVYSNPMYVEILGGVRNINFGRPRNPSMSVIFGKNFLIVTAVP